MSSTWRIAKDVNRKGRLVSDFLLNVLDKVTVADTNIRDKTSSP